MSMELIIISASLRCAIHSQANAKATADRVESKLKLSERVTSDSFDENKEIKQQLDEATSKAESLQSQMLEVKIFFTETKFT